MSEGNTLLLAPPFESAMAWWKKKSTGRADRYGPTLDQILCENQDLPLPREKVLDRSSKLGTPWPCSLPPCLQIVQTGTRLNLKTIRQIGTRDSCRLLFTWALFFQSRGGNCGRNCRYRLSCTRRRPTGCYQVIDFQPSVRKGAPWHWKRMPHPLPVIPYQCKLSSDPLPYKRHIHNQIDNSSFVVQRWSTRTHARNMHAFHSLLTRKSSCCPVVHSFQHHHNKPLNNIPDLISTRIPPFIAT